MFGVPDRAGALFAALEPLQGRGHQHEQDREPPVEA